MKKIIFLLVISLFTCSCIAGDSNFDKKNNLNILTLFSSPLTGQNDLWVGTFQLVFNDMKNKVLKLDKIEFVGEKETPELVGLNKEEFKESMLNESSYYTSYGPTSPMAKEKIKKGIKDKFSESSDIIDSLDWKEEKGRYYAYAMLKKKFDFLFSFDELKKSSFNHSIQKFDYFGINSKSKRQLSDNVRVLFYNNKNDYAVSLITKEEDIVYLYRSNNIKSLESAYQRLVEEKENYQDSRYLKNVDTLKIPNLKVRSKKDYKELCNKQIKGTDLYFSSALETIELELDKKGGKVKSEAILMTEVMSASPIKEPRITPRHFNFDKPFVLFLIDKDKTDPYLGFYIKNLTGLQ